MNNQPLSLINIIVTTISYNINITMRNLNGNEEILKTLSQQLVFPNT